MSDCLNPIPCWFIGAAPCKRDGIVSPVLTFSPNKARAYLRSAGQDDTMLDAIGHSVPCGKCLNCLVRKRRDMATRICKEAQMSNQVCFITLTYNDKSAHKFDPDNWDDRLCLDKTDLQKFIKRLRADLEYKGIVPRGTLRYFGVGEYGPKTFRPHYHLILFGWKPTDIKLHGKSKSNHLIYTSETLKHSWDLGFSYVEDFSPHAARYCARYVTKKLTKDKAPQLDGLPDEFFLASKGRSSKLGDSKGGIGALWCDMFGGQSASEGFVLINQGNRLIKAATPAYFLDRVRTRSPLLWQQIRERKLNWSLEHVGETVDSSIRKMLYSTHQLKLETERSTL